MNICNFNFKEVTRNMNFILSFIAFAFLLGRTRNIDPKKNCEDIKLKLTELRYKTTQLFTVTDWEVVDSPDTQGDSKDPSDTSAAHKNEARIVTEFVPFGSDILTLKSLLTEIENNIKRLWQIAHSESTDQDDSFYTNLQSIIQCMQKNAAELCENTLEKFWRTNLRTGTSYQSFGSQADKLKTIIAQLSES